MKNRRESREKRHFRLRKKIFGTSAKPRLAVFVSNKNFYAQIIDDDNHKTLCSYSSLNLKEKGNNQQITAKLGEEIAKLAKAKAITEVVFDRGGFLYHGKIKVFAEAVRANGLKF